MRCNALTAAAFGHWRRLMQHLQHHTRSIVPVMLARWQWQTVAREKLRKEEGAEKKERKWERERERSSGQLVEESGKMHGSSARQRHTGPDEGRSGRRVSGTNNRRSRRSRDTTPSSRNHRSRSKLKRDIYYRYTTAVCDRLSECAIMRWPILQTARRLPRTLPSAGRISGWMLLGSSWRLRISRLWGERVNHDVVTAFVDGCIFVFISA